jgi:N-acetylneuraminic acid mutarotase
VTFVLATVVNSLAVAAGEFAPGSPAADPGPLADRKAIEEVYWSHRIWPSVNRASKPELSAVLVDSVLRERIADHLRKRAALEKYWSRRVTAPQVQAELDRMAAHTKAPKVLAEIFAALHNDPQRIAASLAEPALVDRLIRSWYAGDGRFHEEAQRRAERSLARPDNAADLRAMDGEFVETEYLRRDAAAPASSGGDGSLEDGASGAALDAAAWAGLLGRLATAFDMDGASRERPDSLPRRITSRLVDESDAFRVYRVLEAGSDRVRVQSVSWPKRDFDDWWREARVGLTPLASPAVAGHYTLPALAGACVDDTWSPMASETPYGRANHTAVWTGTEMIIWGGQSTALGVLGDGWRYNPATDTWLPTALDVHTPSARSGHTAVWTGTQMIVWGGSANFAVAMPLGARYDPQTDSWAAVRGDATAPSARFNHAAVWTGSEMIVWGGAGTSPGFCICDLLNTGGRYNPNTDTWIPTRVDVTAPEPRSAPTAVWTGSEMIVWGGYKQGQSGSHADVNTGGRYDPLTDSWVLIQGGGGRSNHSVVWTGTRMVVWGGVTRFWRTFPPVGEVSTLLNSGSRYDLATNSWASTSVTPVTPTARSGHTAIWSGTRMVVWGGSASPGAQYDPGPDEWTPVRADATAPPGATGGTAVWTGNEMIVWGGSESNNGGRYDPAQDTWVRTAVEGAFPGGARPQGMGVWTGSEFIVWRGPGLAGRYDPATDQWGPMTSVGSPQARTVNSAVWTGNEMIVWGGLTDLGFNPVSGGGAYDPTLNHWTSIGSGGLTARSGHTAVWTGTEMIVWGGYACCTYQATGARYNPATQTWSPTRADATTPAGRSYHTAVWTGSEMIVWGGENGTGGFSSGGRYDPVADTWTPTPVDGSGPSVTSRHTSVWTGSEMITWDGLQGWAYNPGAGAWRTIRNDTSAPEPRWRYVSVWTGDEMIVWGGARLGGGPATLINTGGRYDPVSNTWISTRTDSSTPFPREDAAAVWAGDVMLVWGGIGPAFNGTVFTGGAYCAGVCQPVTWYFDGDGDGHGDADRSLVACGAPVNYTPTAGDCNDHAAQVWTTPAEARDLMFTSTDDLAWSPPNAPGATALTYDLVRSSAPDNFAYNVVCLGAGTAATTATDLETPDEGQVFYYLVRAVNGCPSGDGILGTSSDGTPVPGFSCP